MKYRMLTSNSKHVNKTGKDRQPYTCMYVKSEAKVVAIHTCIDNILGKHSSEVRKCRRLEY